VIEMNPLERIVGELADRLAPAVSLPIQHYDDKLAQWVAFHGLEGTNITTIVAHQAALNLVLKGLICHLAGAGPLPDPAPASCILAEADTCIQSAGWGHLPHSYLDDLALENQVTIDVQATAQLLSFLKANVQQDVIGALYSKLVPQDARRTLGQFWTPAPIAEFMTQWVVQEPDDRVLDPAFGSGVFLLAAIKRLITLGQLQIAASRQVAGVELSPLAFLMGAANVLLHYPQARPSLQLGDFMVPCGSRWRFYGNLLLSTPLKPCKWLCPGWNQMCQRHSQVALMLSYATHPTRDIIACPKHIRRPGQPRWSSSLACASVAFPACLPISSCRPPEC